MKGGFHVSLLGNERRILCFTVRYMATVFHISQQEKWQQCFMFYSKGNRSKVYCFTVREMIALFHVLQQGK
jgi:hypothetical protein